MAKPTDLSDRAALAQAITLVESTRPDHREQSEALLQSVLPKTGKSIRVGISGVPGVGKSSFIETFGMHVLNQKHKVAVLAVDPSSKRTGGSIMGDKTRMFTLAQDERAFIRPTPTSGALGGVARHTREAVLLCEAAGYDVIIVETVGVGQSETDVADMVDMFLLLLPPGGGDELQGIKKGIVEMADLVIVNKADGDLLPAARRAQAEYAAALRMLTPAHPEWKPEVLLCSARENTGIAEIWQGIGKFQAAMQKAGHFDRRRKEQALSWMWREVSERLIEDFRADPAVNKTLAGIKKELEEQKVTVSKAAAKLLQARPTG